MGMGTCQSVGSEEKGCVHSAWKTTRGMGTCKDMSSEKEKVLTNNTWTVLYKIFGFFWKIIRRHRNLASKLLSKDMTFCSSWEDRGAAFSAGRLLSKTLCGTNTSGREICTVAKRHWQTGSWRNPSRCRWHSHYIRSNPKIGDGTLTLFITLRQGREMGLGTSFDAWFLALSW